MAEDDVLKELANLSEKVANSLANHQKIGKTLVLKIRYADFTTLTKRRSLEEATRDPEAIQRLAQELYQSLESNSSGIRLLGVTLTNFSSESRETHEGSLIEETP